MGNFGSSLPLTCIYTKQNFAKPYNYGVICETLIHLILFAITDVFSNLLLSKIIINPHIFTYTRLEIYTPSSAFSTVFHFRSLYPNRYKTSCNITHILHYLRPFQVLSVAFFNQLFRPSFGKLILSWKSLGKYQILDL